MTQPPPASPGKGSRKVLHIILGVLTALAVLVGVFVFALLSGDSKDDKKSSSSSTTSSTTIKDRNADDTTTTTVKLSDDQEGEFSTEYSIKAFSSGGVTGNSSLPKFSETGNDPAIDQLVPTITAQDFDGKTVTIAAGKKPMMLVFVAHWCPHCQNELPIIIQLQKDGKIPSDVQLVAIATATDEQKPNFPPSKWLQEEHWPGDEIADTVNSDIASAFGLPGYPYVVYVSSEGTVALRTSGEQGAAQIEKYAKSISLLENA